MSEYIVLFGLVVYVVGWLGTVRIAFEEDKFEGYWVVFFPLAWFRFLSTQPERTFPYAIVCFVGLLIVLFGIIVGQVS